MSPFKSKMQHLSNKHDTSLILVRSIHACTSDDLFLPLFDLFKHCQSVVNMLAREFPLMFPCALCTLIFAS